MTDQAKDMPKHTLLAAVRAVRLALATRVTAFLISLLHADVICESFNIAQQEPPIQCSVHTC